MTEHDWLTQRFAEHRGRLTALAYRMLGSRADAEDAMQESRIFALVQNSEYSSGFLHSGGRRHSQRSQ
jgi:DNA-directed RNA polymerase specialized sigma24 family protein